MPVVAFQKESNRAERAIQTAKHHMIATRAGFHRDCPHRYIDMCLPQMELTLNILHPYEYDPSISASAHHGLCDATFDFMSHPIAPAGSKVLTWDSPDTRGSWVDHGTEGIYVGPALNHFRAFRIWVAQNSAMRVSATVWWFLPSFVIDNSLLSLPTDEISYPPTRTRPHPQSNGADLLGRHFFESDLSVCCVTRLGPITNKQMPSRAQRNITNPSPTGPISRCVWRLKKNSIPRSMKLSSGPTYLRGSPQMTFGTCSSGLERNVARPVTRQQMVCMTDRCQNQTCRLSFRTGPSI
jgi:hypothetical protein